ncbi:MAG: pyruvate kinase [Microscillaceae bacterium]|nr:pyruvate kinase [Microscillaceae bacterium]
MFVENQRIREMISQLQSIRNFGKLLEERFADAIEEAHPQFTHSVVNLLNYLAIRNHNVYELQNDLGRLGLSRLGKAESHVLASMRAIENHLKRILGDADLPSKPEFVNFDTGKSLLEEHACQLLGEQPKDRRVRIMVTFPSEAADDYALVKNLLLAGMNCARLNCAHDDEKTWFKMIQNLRKAQEETGLTCKVCMDLAGPKLRTGSLAPGGLAAKDQKISLEVGDILILHKDDRPGEPAILDEKGQIITPAHIAVPLPNLYRDLQPGENILFDDGKIEGIIRTVHEDEIRVEITYTPIGGAKLKAEKGINLPNSNLSITGLTEKDREDLKFVAAHADVINMSFVNSARDVDDLLEELKNLNAPPGVGIILKIETQKSVINLPEILIRAMKHYPLGVMIARGDLAIECGWKHLAEVQEEILRICEAAHVPNIWATQVLETVAKTGRPSRAEITDAAMAQRAECVMLNKGPFILEAISILVDILESMQFHQEKKAPILPILKVPENFTFKK